MADSSDTHDAKRIGPLRRLAGALRGWLFSGGCRSCKSHEEDVDRWQRELAEQRGEETKDARGG